MPCGCRLSARQQSSLHESASARLGLVGLTNRAHDGRRGDQLVQQLQPLWLGVERTYPPRWSKRRERSTGDIRRIRALEILRSIFWIVCEHVSHWSEYKELLS